MTGWNRAVLAFPQWDCPYSWEAIVSDKTTPICRCTFVLKAEIQPGQGCSLSTSGNGTAI